MDLRRRRHDKAMDSDIPGDIGAIIARLATEAEPEGQAIAMG